MSTHYLVCYDIKEDDYRFAVADHCKDAGLVRIQYSVFYGLLSRSEVNTLQLKLERTVKGSNSDIHIIKVCSSCENDHQVITAINTDTMTIDVNSHQEIADEYEDLVVFL